MIKNQNKTKQKHSKCLPHLIRGFNKEVTLTMHDGFSEFIPSFLAIGSWQAQLKYLDIFLVVYFYVFIQT